MAKKATLTPVTDTALNAGAINTQLNAINNKLDNTLSLDGSVPNAMGADVDLNSNDLLNVKDLSMTGELSIDGVGLNNAFANAAASEAAAAVSATSASLSATQAAQYDGIWLDDVATLLADTTLTYTAGQPSTVVVGDYVRTRKEGFAYQVATSGDVTTAGGIQLDVVVGWRSEAFGGNATLFANAVRSRSASLVANGTLLEVLTGETIVVACDPSSVSLKDYVAYMSLNHSVQGEGSLTLEIADGLHNVNTVVDVDNSSSVHITATAAADEFPISSMTYADQGGGVWRVTVVITSGTLPAYLAAGTVVGIQNPVGNGTPDAAAGGLRVVTRNSDTSLTCEFQSRGVVPLVNMTTPTAGATLGMTHNILVVPKCCIRADSAGWTGGGVGFEEGFINARNGAKITLDGIALSYNGTADGHEMLFAKDMGSVIQVFGKSVVVGDCTNLTRCSYGGTIDCFGAMLGLASGGDSIWQGVAECAFYAVRTMMVGGASEMLSATATCGIFVSQSILSGGLVGLKTTYPSAFIDVVTSRIRHCGSAAQPTRGVIYIAADTSIEYCTTVFVVTGSNYGEVRGVPTLANNTNAVITANEIQANGGAWITGKTYDPDFFRVGRFTGVLDFPSIAANSYADLTVAASGAAFNDFCMVARSGSSEPAQGIMFRAFVSAADVVTVRAYNVTTGAINPTAFTSRVLVLRAT